MSSHSDLVDARGMGDETRASNASLHTAFAAMGEAVLILDAQGRVVEVNDAFLAFHRLPPRDGSAFSLDEYARLLEFHRRDGTLLPVEQWAVARAQRGETARDLEIELRHVESGERWYGSYNFAPFRDDAGNIIGSVVTARDVTAARRTQRQLIEERQRISLLLESSYCALWTADLVQKTMTHDNIDWLARYGFTAGDAPTNLETWLARIHPADQALVLTTLDSLLRGEVATTNTDFRVLGGDDEWHWIQNRAMVTARGDDGHATQLTCLALNIHDRLVAEQAVIANEERLKLVFQAAGLGVWDWDIEKNVFTHNEQMAAMLGYPQGFFADREASLAIIHPDDFAGAAADMRGSLSGRKSSLSYEMRLRNATGDWHWVMTRGQVVARDARGKALRMIGVHIDIAAKKTAEIALATSEARLRAVVDNVPLGIVLTDAAGQTKFVNQAFRTILGLDATGPVTLGWVDRIEAGDREAMLRNQQAMLAGDLHEFQLEFRYRRSADDLRVVRSQVVRVDAPHADFSFIGVGEDVTAERARDVEHERMRQQAQQSQKMEAIGQLAGGIAHDFNNILAAVVGFGELAMKRFAGDRHDKLAEYLETIIAAGERGRDLVSKMLAFSRTSPNTPLAAIEVVPVVEEVTHMLSTIIPSTIRFEVVEEGPVAPILINPVDLHQVLINLAVNARDAINGHGVIQVTIGGSLRGTTRCSACHAPLVDLPVRIAVRDSGSGIAPDVLGRIFDPFFTTKDVGKGTGMGLSVVHGVVHQTGGHIVVESAPHHGTEFHLLFPAAPHPSAVATADPTARARAATLAGIRVLVVDDEQPMRRYLGDLFESEGMHVTATADGREALALIRARPQDFDLIFTDQTMPGMTGIEMLEALRASDVILPVVLMSGYTDEATRLTVARCGARFLAKPALPADALEAAALALTVCT